MCGAIKNFSSFRRRCRSIVVTEWFNGELQLTDIGERRDAFLSSPLQGRCRGAVVTEWLSAEP